jgi:hypothetical protein
LREYDRIAQYYLQPGDYMTDNEDDGEANENEDDDNNNDKDD